MRGPKIESVFAASIKYANKFLGGVVAALSEKKHETDTEKLPAATLLLLEDKKRVFDAPLKNQTQQVIAMYKMIRISQDRNIVSDIWRREPLLVKRLRVEDDSKTTILQLKQSVQQIKDKPEKENICCKVPSVSAPIAFFRSVSSFFNNVSKVDTAKLIVKALNNFRSLVEQMKSESDDWQMALMDKLQHSYDPDDQDFIHEVIAAISNYPEYTEDMSLLAEIEQVTSARIAHHEKIKAAVIGYLSRSYANAVEAQSKTMEM